MTRSEILATQVRALYAELERAGQTIGAVCPADCAECCHNPKISATLLEFIPLAITLKNSGQAEELLARLSAPEASQSGCLLTRENRCRVYPDRGLICRLFGASARRDRELKLEYLACRHLHQERGRYFASEDKPPLAEAWSLRLITIDPSLGTRWLQINQAIAEAIEFVLTQDYFKRASY